MKTKFFKLLALLFVLWLYPFSCVGQTNGTIPNNDSCDTIFIEDPSVDAMIKRLTEENLAALENIATLENTVADNETTIRRLNDIIETDGQTMTELSIKVDGLTSDLALANKQLEACQNQAPEIDTVFVEKDFITVNGKEYKVAEIELIVPTEEIDTIELTICWRDPEKKVWLHATDNIDVYPHLIHIPTKEKGLIPVTFTDSLTLDMKRYQTTWKMMRVINHQKGETQYKNLYVDPSTYLPTN